MLYLKRIIRRWVSSLYFATSKWVVPHVVWSLIDEGNYPLAASMLAEAREKYGADPMITKAEVMMKRHSIIGR